MRGATNQSVLRMGAPRNPFGRRIPQRGRNSSSFVRRFKENQRAEEQVDLYAVLELSPDSNGRRNRFRFSLTCCRNWLEPSLYSASAAEEIKAQYRTMQKLCHPDISGNEVGRLLHWRSNHWLSGNVHPMTVHVHTYRN